LVGFAAETESVATAAKSKLQIKKADLMVANDVTLSDSGFDSDFNTVTLLAADDSEVAYPRLLKSEVAKLILDKVAALLGSCRKTLLSG
jgi:phosphopantothenoylcysteine decarboxylase/phosphopantothenate--cysteine ligase